MRTNAEAFKDFFKGGRSVAVLMPLTGMMAAGRSTCFQATEDVFSALALCFYLRAP
jgi:hypothetical protein